MKEKAAIGLAPGTASKTTLRFHSSTPCAPVEARDQHQGIGRHRRAPNDAQGASLTKVFTLQTCRHCGLDFQPITWLQWRAVGFCKAKCLDEWALLRSPDALGG